MPNFYEYGFVNTKKELRVITDYFFDIGNGNLYFIRIKTGED